MLVNRNNVSYINYSINILAINANIAIIKFFEKYIEQNMLAIDNIEKKFTMPKKHVNPKIIEGAIIKYFLFL